MIGGSENPINNRYFSVKDLLEFTNYNIDDINLFLKKIDTEADETWLRLSNFFNAIEEPSLNRYVRRYPSVIQGLKAYGSVTELKRLGLPGPSYGTDWEDLNGLKLELAGLSNDLEEVYERLNTNFRTASVEPDVFGLVLKGLEWLQELNIKITQKITNLTTHLFGLEIFDFFDLVNALRDEDMVITPENEETPNQQNDVQNANTPQSSVSSGSRGRSRSRRSSRSRNRRSSSGSRGRSRSSSRSRRSSSSSRGRSSSRSSSDSSSSRGRSRTRSRNRRSSSGSRGRSRSRPRSRNRSISRRSTSSGIGSLERRLAELQQMEDVSPDTPQRESSPDELERRLAELQQIEDVSPIAPRREGSSDELERRFNELQNEGVRRSLFQ